ncbi:MAG: OmpA family protein [Bacteroidetes bacterium]|nr:MAG: OmpA family protein [Bacteroidota bacterium]
MKRFTFLLLLLGLQLALWAQEAPNPHAMSARVLGIDYSSLNEGAEGDVTFGLEIAYRYLLNNKLGLAVPLKIGVADVKEDIDNRNIVSLDAMLHLYPFGAQRTLAPYLLGGAGYVVEAGDGGNAQFPMGMGFNYMVGGNSYLSVQGEYRSSSTDFRDNIQLGVGYLLQFGNTDSDKDGVVNSDDRCPDEAGSPATGGCPDQDMDGLADVVDACPEEAGPRATDGCPDTDEDGVPNLTDLCPELAGTAATDGCPDTDGDGIANADDMCPELAGTAAWMGCPDTDGDGLHDGEDKCPKEAGSTELMGCPGADRDGDGVLDAADECPDETGEPTTQGCPDRDKDLVRDADDRCPDQAGPFAGCPDTDGDGVIDADDRCPQEAGPSSNKGCPEIEDEVKDVLELAMRAVQFETGSAELLPSSYNILDQIAEIMVRYPAYQLRISGHTDNVGDKVKNQELSEARAAACYEYLLRKGVQARRISYAGFGEDYPIAPNSSSSGRSLNRRVEFDLIIQ